MRTWANIVLRLSLVVGLAIPTFLFSQISPEFAEFRGKKVPSTVDLSYQFNPNKIQIGGTCHVYTAVDIVEAALYRITEHHFDLSEAYLVYRHLREKLASNDELDPENEIDPMRFLFEGASVSKRKPITKEDKLVVSTFSRDKYPLSKEVAPYRGKITISDGGKAEDTVKRILRGDVCTDKEFDENPLEFYAFLRDLFDESRKKASKKARERLPISISKNKFSIPNFTMEGSPPGHSVSAVADRLIAIPATNQFTEVLTTHPSPESFEEIQVQAENIYQECIEEFCIEADSKTKAIVPIPKKDDFGWRTVTKNKALIEALQKLKIQPEIESTHMNMVDLLASGTPFLCSANYTRKNLKTYFRHAFTVVGYALDDEAPGGVRYLIRSPNGEDAVWGTIHSGACRMLVLN